MRTTNAFVTAALALGLTLGACGDKKTDAPASAPEAAAAEGAAQAEPATAAPKAPPSAAAAGDEPADDAASEGSVSFEIGGEAPWGAVTVATVDAAQTVPGRYPGWTEATSAGEAEVDGQRYRFVVTLRIPSEDKAWKKGEFTIGDTPDHGVQIALLPVEGGEGAKGFKAKAGKIVVTEVGPKGVFVGGKKNDGKVVGTFEATGTDAFGEGSYTAKGTFAIPHRM